MSTVALVVACGLSITIFYETFTSFRSQSDCSSLVRYQVSNTESTLACQVQEDSYRGTRGEGFSKDDRDVMLPFTDFFSQTHE